MKETLGTRFTRLRKEKGYTQETIAEKLNVSPQAVSKWENDYSAPDISLLVLISNILDTSIDSLLGKDQKIVSVVPEEKRKNISGMFFRIIAKSNDGSFARINIPIAVIKTILESGLDISTISSNEALKGVDFDAIFLLLDQGVIGKIIEAESADGDSVTIMIE